MWKEKVLKYEKRNKKRKFLSKKLRDPPHERHNRTKEHMETLLIC